MTSPGDQYLVTLKVSRRPAFAESSIEIHTEWPGSVADAIQQAFDGLRLTIAFGAGGELYYRVADVAIGKVPGHEQIEDDRVEPELPEPASVLDHPGWDEPAPVPGPTEPDENGVWW